MAGGIAYKKERSLNKAIRYRAYPNKEQLKQIWTNIHCARAVFNIMLAEKIEHYKACGKMLRITPAQCKNENPWLRDADSSALCNAQIHLEQAFRSFFEDPNVGFPKFKARHKTRCSYTTCVSGQNKNNIRFEDGCILLPKVMLVRIKMHRTAPADWQIKSATIEVSATGKVYVSVLYEYENQVVKVTPEKYVGLDYSSPYLYIDSEGCEPEYEKPFARYQNKLAREQRKLSKMKESNKGRRLSECRNYQKQKLKVAKIHEKIANCRKDSLHKLANELADKYDVIGVENLNLKAISQGLNLGKATLDNGYGIFLKLLEYKLNDRGKYLVKVDKHFASTKTCSCCGNKKPMKLSEREYICPKCGLVIDRDLNAAINIREEAKRILA